MRKQGYLGLMDMINGGGAGASGAEFQGGGVLSALSNAFAQPLGSQQRQDQMPQSRPMARPGPPMMQPPMQSASLPQSASMMQPPMPSQPTANPHPPMMQPVQGPPMARPQARPPMQGPQMAQEPQGQSEAFADWVVGTYGDRVAEGAAEDREVLGQLIREYLKDK